MSKKKIIIFPFNGNGIEALDCINDQDMEFIGFIDDSKEKLNAKHNWPVFSREILNQYPDVFVLAVPGSPLTFLKRSEFIQSLNLPPDKFISLIHPSVSLGRNVVVGTNCLILAGVVITSNAQIGSHVCILPNTVIHHDTRIGDYTLIGSNVAVAGGTAIGRNCYIGSGSNIMNGINIGSGALIGLGSNVLADVPENARIAGNPAKPIKPR